MTAKVYPSVRCTASLAVLTCLLACLPALSAGRVTTYRYRQDIAVPDLTRDQLVAVPLVPDVYDGVKVDYADLRILRDDGTEVPRIIQRQVKTSESTIEKRHGATIENLVRPDNNRIELMIRVPDKIGKIAGLALATPLRNYERSVSVYGRSEEGGEWAPLVTQTALYDYSRFADVRGNTVHFADEGTYSVLKIDIHAVTDVQASRLTELRESFSGGEQLERVETKTVERRPFRVDAVYVLTRHTRERVESVVKQAYPADGVRIETNESGVTVVNIETYRQPLTEIRVRTASRNFSRPVVVKAEKSNEERVIGRGVLYDFTYRELHEEKVAVEFPETRARDVQLVVDNGDNPPIDVNGIDLQGPVYEMVFLAKPGAVYRAYYGHETAQPPDYDVSAIERLLDNDYAPVAARLQARRENPDYATSPTRFLGSKAFFVAVVVIMLAVLALALYSAARRA